MTAAKTFFCENCGEGIGMLEVPMVFEDHVVCATCYRKLILYTCADAPAPVIPAVVSPSRLDKKPRKRGDSTGFVTLSLVLLGLALSCELTGNPAGSWLLMGLWFVLLVVRLAISSSNE